jgi:hypothetical protein
MAARGKATAAELGAGLPLVRKESPPPLIGMRFDTDRFVRTAVTGKPSRSFEG